MTEQIRRLLSEHNPRAISPVARREQRGDMPRAAVAECSQVPAPYNVRCVCKYSVILLLKFLNLYWDSLLFRGGPELSLRIHWKRIVHIARSGHSSTAVE